MLTKPGDHVADRVLHAHLAADRVHKVLHGRPHGLEVREVTGQGYPCGQRPIIAPGIDMALGLAFSRDPS